MCLLPTAEANGNDFYWVSDVCVWIGADLMYEARLELFPFASSSSSSWAKATAFNVWLGVDVDEPTQFIRTVQAHRVARVFPQIFRYQLTFRRQFFRQLLQTKSITQYTTNKVNKIKIRIIDLKLEQQNKKKQSFTFEYMNFKWSKTPNIKPYDLYCCWLGKKKKIRCWINEQVYFAVSICICETE